MFDRALVLRAAEKMVFIMTRFCLAEEGQMTPA